MPIVVRPRKGDDTQGLIRKFKKFLQIDDPVQIVRDRRYHKPPSVLKKEAMQEVRNRKKRIKIASKKKGGLQARPVRPTRGRPGRDGERGEGRGGERGESRGPSADRSSSRY